MYIETSSMCSQNPLHQKKKNKNNFNVLMPSPNKQLS